MAYDRSLMDITLVAATDLSSNQFSAVAVNSSGQAALPTAGADVCGVLQDKPTSGSAGRVRVHGITKMTVGAATVNAGDKVMVDVNGKAVTAVTGNFVIGKALLGGASGTIISVLLQPGGKI